jgi:MoaA/NifB/PqqE/SkfB family radical SAM enzyme/SAM-dependent methyltransferase
MITTKAEGYQRIIYDNVPIYVNPEIPDWFIPTDRADYILGLLKENNDISSALSKYMRDHSCDFNKAYMEIENLLGRINNNHIQQYKGRSHYRELKGLKECWFHITNQCNMACSHCMFSSDNKSQPSLSCGDVIKAMVEAYKLGCRIFYFTGGEPFIYPKFTKVCDEILKRDNTHIVILTNSKNIKSFDEWLRKTPTDRIHFQISIDGLKENHESMRGKGTFDKLLESLQYFQKFNFPVSLAMSVNIKNVGEISSIIEIASDFNIKNVHYLWFFKKGKGVSALFVKPEGIFKHLVKAYEKASDLGITIDNFEILKSQIFCLPGTRFDLSNAAWESIAIGPEGNIYPSPALIGENELIAGNIDEGLKNVWGKSNVFDKIRGASLIESDKIRNHSLKYFTGGGDIDHSYIAAKTFVGADPYLELYNLCTLYLLAKESQNYIKRDILGMVCRMGERLYECDEDSASVGFTHSNCVLSLPGKDRYSSVRSFYSNAAEDVNEDIINPVQYDEHDISYIPQESRVRSYGCGSPVKDCGLKEEEVLVDLGSGTGTECFVASRIVGPRGRVYGIDMADAMLKIADKSRERVSRNLGYENTEFRKGFLENIPLESRSVDVVISNCVINLSSDKRKTLSEILRILKPGGRICISDIVCDDEIPLEIKYNEKLRGECIGGAMREDALFSMLADIGFESLFIKKRFLYRQVKGYAFYAVTYSAHKPKERVRREIIYRGPLDSVILSEGQILRQGRKAVVDIPSTIEFDESFFVLDESGNPTNVKQEMTCSCFIAPEANIEQGNKSDEKKYKSGCVVCGARLEYFDKEHTEVCHYCNKSFNANAVCVNSHFVCDRCHSQDAIEVIKNICLESKYDDMVKLLRKIRGHSSIPLHGPEHHAMVPGIILSVLKNKGGNISEDDIIAGIERGRTIAGGACAFMGVCGAAVGAGIGYSVILKSNPYKGKERQIVQQITSEVLKKIGQYNAPRCCQRDCWIALKAVSELSEKYSPVYLPANEGLVCSQYKTNQECISKDCPLWLDK